MTNTISRYGVVPLHFREDKATQAAAHLVSLRGGTMSYLKLIKLMYLADRASLIRYGRPITYDSYVSLPFGPVLSRTLDLIKSELRPGSSSIWQEYLHDAANYSVRLEGDPGKDKLSSAEVEMLDEVFRDFGARSRWELVDYTHGLTEYVDPEGSSRPIAIEDILLAGGHSQEDVEAIISELASQAALDGLADDDV